MQTKREVYMFLILAFVVALLVGFFYLFKKEEINDVAVEDPRGFSEPAEEYTVTGLVIPSEVYRYVGQVNEVGSDHIFVNAQSHNNYLSTDTVLEISFDQNTVFERYSYPKTISNEALRVERTSEVINYSELNVGDLITITSSENARGKTKFYASKIIVSRPL